MLALCQSWHAYVLCLPVSLMGCYMPPVLIWECEDLGFSHSWAGLIPDSQFSHL